MPGMMQSVMPGMMAPHLSHAPMQQPTGPVIVKLFLYFRIDQKVGTYHLSRLLPEQLHLSLRKNNKGEKNVTFWSETGVMRFCSFIQSLQGFL